MNKKKKEREKSKRESICVLCVVCVCLSMFVGEGRREGQKGCVNGEGRSSTQRRGFPSPSAATDHSREVGGQGVQRGAAVPHSACSRRSHLARAQAHPQPCSPTHVSTCKHRLTDTLSPTHTHKRKSVLQRTAAHAFTHTHTYGTLI